MALDMSQFYQVFFEETAEHLGNMESLLLDLMHDIEARYPGVTLFSLPFLGSATQRRHIELGLRGDPAQVAAGMAEIRTGVTRLGYAWDEAENKTTNNAANSANTSGSAA